MSIVSIISLLSGLAFFLFGMSLMGDALKRVAGGKLETLLGRLTSNAYKGVALGTGVTAIIQSSSATSVMVVGFVNSGIMTLAQGIPIIMGAQIGTTATSWLLSLSSIGNSEAASLFSTAAIFGVIAVIGILLYMVGKSSAKKNSGMILLSLSILMSGMRAMSDAMEPLQHNATFLHAMSVVSNPLLCILIGIVVTAVVQSCSASIGILQALAVTGVIEFRIAVYMVVGMSVGACVPVLISSIGASLEAKRTAFTYLYFDVIAGVVFCVLFAILDAFTGIFSVLNGPASSVMIALINTSFKVFGVVLLFPFRSVLEMLAMKMFPDIPSDDDEEEFEKNLLDERFLDYPSVAIEQAGRTIDLMATASRKNLLKSIELLDDFSQEKYDKIMRREDRVDKYEDSLGSYLVKLSGHELSPLEVTRSSTMLQSLTNLERISDHAVNIAELAEELHNKGIRFSDNAKKEIKICIGAMEEILDLVVKALQNRDVDAASRVEPLEDIIDIMTEKMKANHVRRLQTGRCTLDIGFVFNDCINNFERVADHCSNVALIILENQTDIDLATHSYAANMKIDKAEEYQLLADGYRARYLIPLEETQNAANAAYKEGKQISLPAADLKPETTADA